MSVPPAVTVTEPVLANVLGENELAEPIVRMPPLTLTMPLLLKLLAVTDTKSPLLTEMPP